MIGASKLYQSRPLLYPGADSMMGSRLGFEGALAEIQSYLWRALEEGSSA